MSIPIWKAALHVASAELRGSFRDRQTFLYAVVLPICMYPVLFWLIVQGALVIQGRRERTEVRLGLCAARPDELPPELCEALERSPGGQEAAEQASGSQIEPMLVERASLALDAEGATAWLVGRSTGEQRLDAVLWVPERGAAAPPLAQVYFDGTSSRSGHARRRVEARLASFLERIRAEAASARGASPEELVPFEVAHENVAPRRDMLAYVLSFLLPMLLVVMCVMGAFFPAVDVTAGEKERSTVETTLLLPVPRAAVHQGKILAVCAASVLASALNLAALGVSAGHLLSMLSSELETGLTEIPVLALVAVLPLALLFAFFVSAILVGIASLAASFKEGQALLGPVQMLFILPALAGVLPGLELDVRTAFVPVVNVVLAFRSMLQGRVMTGEYALVGLSLLLYALLSIRAALRVLSRESVQLSTETLPLSRLAQLLRAPRHER